MTNITVKLPAGSKATLLTCLSRPGSISEGDHYAGMVWVLNRAARETKATLTTAVEQMRGNTLRLTKTQGSLLLQLITIGGTHDYTTILGVNANNFPIVAGLAAAGIDTFPDRDTFYG